MAARQSALIAALCSMLVFVALATVLHTWQAMWSWLGDAMGVWLPIIGEGVR